MQRKMMEIANIWLPIVGSILLGGIAVGAWYGGNKVAALWLAFAGVVCFLLLVVLQIQAVLNTKEPELEPSALEQMKLRAYLSPNLAIASDFGTELPTSAQITTNNSGETPAYDVRVRVGMAAGIFPLKDYAAIPMTEGAIPLTIARGEIVHLVTKIGRALTQQEIDEIKAGKGAVYVVGEITYTDKFKKPHSCTFKFYYGGDAGTRHDGMMASQEKNCD
jgi:hypothetical protein